MFSRVMELILSHIKKNADRYFMLLVSFILGIAAGAFTVNGLSSIQRYELSDYFDGFLKLLGEQNVDSAQLLQISAKENMKAVLLIWFLGVTIVGIPFILLVIGIRGFITGFASGFIIRELGFKGVIFSLVAILPKEIFIIPCIIAIGVNAINFSLSIMKNKPLKSTLRDSFKSNFMAYCGLTLFFSTLMSGGILLEAYLLPTFIKMMVPVITG